MAMSLQDLLAIAGGQGMSPISQGFLLLLGCLKAEKKRRCTFRSTTIEP